MNLRALSSWVALIFQPFNIGMTPPWSRARVDCGIQIKLKCSDRAILAERRSQQKKNPLTLAFNLVHFLRVLYTLLICACVRELGMRALS